MRMHAPAFLRHLRRVCDAHGLLLIDDEVFTGYGRTGTMWAIEQAGVRPDLLCTAKGFSGGVLPMAATLATDAVYQAFYGAPEKTFFHGHSFCGNPLGARVALEVLRVFRDERVLEGIPERSARIRACFERIAASQPATARPRTLGMVGAIDLVEPRAPERSTSDPARDDDEDEKVPWSERPGYLGQAGWRVHAEARRRGAYLRPLGDVVYVAPPLNIGLADLDELLGIVEDSVAAALAP
jgi:adenosylmethionine-8-amino-7-oxononanoate aminotransferase